MSQDPDTSATATAAQRESHPIMWVDEPPSGLTLTQPFLLRGWAIDQGAEEGTGIEYVHVLGYLNPDTPGLPIDLGAATYGSSRADIANAYGARFEHSGFVKEMRGIPPGDYRLEVYAHSAVSNTAHKLSTRVLINANPQMWIDRPLDQANVGPCFEVGGWAAELAAETGVGVDGVEVWAQPEASGSPPVFLGDAIVGKERPDVAVRHGDQFLHAGFRLDVTDAPPGRYELVVSARSALTGVALTERRHVNIAASRPALAIEWPPAGAILSEPFFVTGWAADLGVWAGVGVDLIEVHAISSDGDDPSESTLLGEAVLGESREDLRLIHGPQFFEAGYGYGPISLDSGEYTIEVRARSVVTGKWIDRRVTITVR